MSKMTLIQIEVGTYDRLQKLAKGGLFRDPPIYRKGKIFIEVDGEILEYLQKYAKEHKCKNLDEAVNRKLDESKIRLVE